MRWQQFHIDSTQLSSKARGDWKYTKTVNFISRADSFESFTIHHNGFFLSLFLERLTHDSWSGITNLFVSKAYHWSFFTNKLNCDDVSRARFNSFVVRIVEYKVSGGVECEFMIVRRLKEFKNSIWSWIDESAYFVVLFFFTNPPSSRARILSLYVVAFELLAGIGGSRDFNLALTTAVFMLQEHDDDDDDEIERWCHGVWTVHVACCLYCLCAVCLPASSFHSFAFFTQTLNFLNERKAHTRKKK